MFASSFSLLVWSLIIVMIEGKNYLVIVTWVNKSIRITNDSFNN